MLLKSFLNWLEYLILSIQIFHQTGHTVKGPAHVAVVIDVLDSRQCFKIRLFELRPKKNSNTVKFILLNLSVKWASLPMR